MQSTGYMIHLLAWLAFIVAVRFAMMLWSEWLAGLVLLPLPFYLVHDSLLWRWKRRRGPLVGTLRYLRLRMWHKGRRLADELDALPHKPRGFCPKCNYPVSFGRCPECGHEITPQNIRVEQAGRLRRHRWKLVSACIATSLIVAGYLLLTKIDWMSRLSLDHVVTLHSWGYDDAEYELERRVRSNSLSKNQLKMLIEKTIIPELLIPQPYPHDAQVPCDLRFNVTVRYLNAYSYFFIRDWACEVDGKPIEQSFRPDEMTGGSKTIAFVLPPADPGEHNVRIRGEVTLAGSDNPRYLPQSAIYSMPFDVELTYDADDQTAQEMIVGSHKPIVVDTPGVCPLTAKVQHANWYDVEQRRIRSTRHLILHRSVKHNLSAVIAGRVLARPKGKGDFKEVGVCYFYRDRNEMLNLVDFPKLQRARELEIRIEPDARVAAFRSQMRCRRYYAEPLELESKREKKKGGIFSSFF